MKKKKKAKCLLKDCACPSEKPRENGLLRHCGKALLLTASYQVFSVFLTSGGVQATQTGPAQSSALRGRELSQASSLSLGPVDNRNAPLYLTCIGCTTGPDNVPCGGTGCTCTGCTSCTHCTDCTRCTDGCTGGCIACTGSCTGGCTGGCTGCTGATITQRNHAQELAQQADALYNAGRYQEALDHYLEAKRTWSYWQTDIDQSIANCRLNLQRQQEAGVLNDQGISYYNNKDWARAEDAFRQAVEKWPGNETFRKNLGLAETQRKNAEASAAAASGMHKAIEDFADTNPSVAPSSNGLEFMTSETKKPQNAANPQIARLMKEVDSIKVPPPLSPGQSPIQFSRFLPGDQASKNILFGTEVGVAVAEVSLKVAGSSMTIAPKLILATGKTFIAMENGADLYLVKQDNTYQEALQLLKDKGSAPLFAATVRALREKKPVPPLAGKEMVRVARAIIDPRLGNGGWHMAWSAMWSPEAKAAGIGRACIELGSELIGHGIEGTVRGMTAARDPAFRAAVDKIASAEAMLKKTSDAGGKAALEEVISKADTIMVRAYEARAIGMGDVASIYTKEEESPFRHKE